jgi:hypothetical protein
VFKLLILLLALLLSLKSQAFTDFMMKKADDLAKVGVYTDAISELIGEIAPDTNLQRSAVQTRDASRKIHQEAQGLIYVGTDAKSLLLGPDIGSDSLEQNLRSSTEYINKMKSFLAKLALLGTDGVTALSTIQTNQTLEQIRKNQATEMAMNQETQQYQLKKQALEDSKMRSFIIKQRATRKAMSQRK